MLRVRPAQPQERIELEALQWRASLATERHREDLLANPDAIDLPLEQIERGDVFVADLDGRVVGFAVLLANDRGAELDGLFVEPSCWRQGVGSALVDEAAHRARQLGLTLAVTAGVDARGFYEHRGFSLEGGAQTQFGPALRMSR